VRLEKLKICEPPTRDCRRRRRVKRLLAPPLISPLIRSRDSSWRRRANSPCMFFPLIAAGQSYARAAYSRAENARVIVSSVLWIFQRFAPAKRRNRSGNEKGFPRSHACACGSGKYNSVILSSPPFVPSFHLLPSPDAACLHLPLYRSLLFAHPLHRSRPPPPPPERFLRD
jgi:hypothetical protein